MDNNNIWDNINPSQVRLPKTILSDLVTPFNQKELAGLYFDIFLKTEEADILSLWSPNTDKEEVDEALNNKFFLRLYLKAPKLNDYTLLVLRIRYSIEKVYPCVVEDVVNNKEYNCADADALKSKLIDIFTAGSFKEMLSNIIAQASEE